MNKEIGLKIFCCCWKIDLGTPCCQLLFVGYKLIALKQRLSILVHLDTSTLHVNRLFHPNFWFKKKNHLYIMIISFIKNIESRDPHYAKEWLIEWPKDDETRSSTEHKNSTSHFSTISASDSLWSYVRSFSFLLSFFWKAISTPPLADTQCVRNEKFASALDQSLWCQARKKAIYLSPL